MLNFIKNIGHSFIFFTFPQNGTIDISFESLQKDLRIMIQFIS